MRTEPGAEAAMLAAGWGGRGRPLPGAKPLDPSGPRAIRIPLGAPGAWPCTTDAGVILDVGLVQSTHECCCLCRRPAVIYY